MNTKNLVFVGGSVFDIFANHTGGIPTGDIKVTTNISGPHLGGGGANTSIVAARLNAIFNLNVETTLITKLGNGANSNRARQELEAMGVNVFDAIESQNFDLPTNIVNNSRLDGTRTIYTSDNTPPAIHSGSLTAIEDIIGAGDFIHLHTSSGDIARISAQYAQQHNKQSCVDTSSYSETLKEILPRVTHAILPNEITLPNGQKNAQPILEHLREFTNIDHAIVMRGKKETILSSRKNISTETIPVNITDVFRTRTEKIFDKSGAGDAARAAFAIAQLNQNTSIRNSLEFAIAIATLSCAYNAREWLQALEENPYILEELTGHQYPEWVTQNIAA